MNYVDIYYMETPPPVTCTLLGAIADPSTRCTEGKGTLVSSITSARSYSGSWSNGVSSPPAPGAPPVLPGSPSPRCD